MKYTKKMVKVPETEYYALINLVRNMSGDHLRTEKALLDARIQENLDNPNISEDLKARIHSQLYKERRTIANIIENRPQRVVIENLPYIPNIAPYLGITKHKTSIKQDDMKQIETIPNERIQSFNGTEYPEDLEKTEDELEGENLDEQSEEKYDSAEEKDTPIENERIPSPIQKIQMSKEIYTKTPKIQITPKKRKHLEKYISTHLDILPISTDGRIIGLNGFPIDKSSLRDTLDYFEGKKATSPKGKYFLERKLVKIPEVRTILGLDKEQTGEGRRRRVLIKLKTIKTPGLVRESEKFVFKPQTWAKF